MSRHDHDPEVPVLDDVDELPDDEGLWDEEEHPDSEFGECDPYDDAARRSRDHGNPLFDEPEDVGTGGYLDD